MESIWPQRGKTTNPQGRRRDFNLLLNRILTSIFRRGGFVEELDPYRTKDKNGQPIFCFKCGTSALGQKKIIACDFCALYWHLDCVHPPLANPPSQTRKWMCPAHAEQGLVCTPPIFLPPNMNSPIHCFVACLATCMKANLFFLLNTAPAEAASECQSRKHLSPKRA